MLNSFKITVLIIISSILLSSCATGARGSAMVAVPDKQQIRNENHLLDRNIMVNSVSGGQATLPLSRSKVGNDDLDVALIATLVMNRLYSGENAEYSLSAQLVDLDQPIIGIVYTVKALIHYELKHIETDNVVYNEEILSEFTNRELNYSAPDRLTLANEGAIRENFKFFVNDILKSVE